MKARRSIPSLIGAALVALFLVGSVPTVKAGGFFFGFSFGPGHRFHRPSHYYRPYFAYSPGYSFHGRYYPAYSYYRPAYPGPARITYSIRPRLGRVYTAGGRRYRQATRRHDQGRYRSYEPRIYHRPNRRKY